MAKRVAQLIADDGDAKTTVNITLNTTFPWMTINDADALLRRIIRELAHGLSESRCTYGVERLRIRMGSK